MMAPFFTHPVTVNGEIVPLRKMYHAFECHNYGVAETLCLVRLELWSCGPGDVVVIGFPGRPPTQMSVVDIEMKVLSLGYFSEVDSAVDRILVLRRIIPWNEWDGQP